MAEPESLSQKGTDAALKPSINGSRNVESIPTHVVPIDCTWQMVAIACACGLSHSKTNSVVVEELQ
jgi:hypothetical protein